MDSFISKILNMGFGNLMDQSRKELALKDETYKKDETDLSELELRYTNTEIFRKTRMLVNDYIACMQTANNRYADLSYIAGIKDTISFLSYLDLIKDGCELKDEIGRFEEI